MTNHLAATTSPYLRQHAANPVDWYPWGSEALEKARRENKPIFLSIGYAACHWCHVMAHESFEDPDTAALMNRNFVNIKVDREERPDLDSLYMSAVVSLTGQGGWPMSVFLTPTLEPFFGGTYFPPRPAHGLPAFKEVLHAVTEAWINESLKIQQAGQELVSHLQQQVQKGQKIAAFTPEMLGQAARTLVEAADMSFGGWGAAPKFPQAMTIEFLLYRYANGDSATLPPALFSLNQMARGGIYDVLGGGFARYSTTDNWLVPHFEKMLYDNALLAQVYLHAWQITVAPSLRRVVEETLAFVVRELHSPEGGFYSSLDADSEGQEGKFYAWTQAEIHALLGSADVFFETAYGLNPHGNWEGKIILQRVVDDSTLADLFGLSIEETIRQLSVRHDCLLSARNARVRPTTDDKVLVCWNGLMLSTFAQAARAFNDEKYLKIAQQNAAFLLTALCPSGRLCRTWRSGQPGSAVFLEDYAALILGLLDLYQADFDPRWYLRASELAEEMIKRFSDSTRGFFDTPHDAEALFARPKDIQDNATPSGNALAVQALLLLFEFSGKDSWRTTAEQALSLAAQLAPRYPTAFARWLSAASFAFSPVKQAAVIGDLNDPRSRSLMTELRNGFRPNLILAAAPFPPPSGSPALLDQRTLVDGQPTVYLCENFVCRLPVNRPDDLHTLLA
jgi:uncharacterized protein